MEGPTRIIPFDLSSEISCDGPATGPTVNAGYLRIKPGEKLETKSYGTSQLLYVIRGQGHIKTSAGAIKWKKGDVIVLPFFDEPLIHFADSDSAMYFIDDSPLLAYLGVKPYQRTVEPTLYPAECISNELFRVDKLPGARHRNRNAIILGSKEIVNTFSASRTLWSAFVTVRPGAVQRPHRHNSIAVDIVVDAKPGCYTLLGKEIDNKGDIINPTRIDWQPDTAFVTPPGLWHGHYNEGGGTCTVMAAQDAGLYEYMRTLDIRFSRGLFGKQ
jgi:gentisate 1,2-dioxygenase